MSFHWRIFNCFLPRSFWSRQNRSNLVTSHRCAGCLAIQRKRRTNFFFLTLRRLLQRRANSSSKFFFHEPVSFAIRARCLIYSKKVSSNVRSGTVSQVNKFFPSLPLPLSFFFLSFSLRTRFPSKMFQTQWSDTLRSFHCLGNFAASVYVCLG